MSCKECENNCCECVKHLKNALEIVRDNCAEDDARSALLVAHMALADNIMDWRKK
jgi:hypothetical protein